MRLIHKNPEPQEWTEYRLKNRPYVLEDGTKRTPFDGSIVSPALKKEQGGICAYCMTRLRDSKTIVEHWIPRDYDASKIQDYKNLHACCDGNKSVGNSVREKNLHCDSSKDKTIITFSPLDVKCINTIQYNLRAGTIESTNAIYNKEIDDILNLNHPDIVASRKAVYKSLVTEMAKENYSHADLCKWSELWNSRGKKDYFRPFCMVALHCIERWIHKKSPSKP